MSTVRILISNTLLEWALKLYGTIYVSTIIVLLQDVLTDSNQFFLIDRYFPKYLIFSRSTIGVNTFFLLFSQVVNLTFKSTVIIV